MKQKEKRAYWQQRVRGQVEAFGKRVCARVSRQMNQIPIPKRKRLLLLLSVLLFLFLLLRVWLAIKPEKDLPSPATTPDYVSALDSVDAALRQCEPVFLQLQQDFEKDSLRHAEIRQLADSLQKLEAD